MCIHMRAARESVAFLGKQSTEGYAADTCIWQAHPPPVDVGTETDGQLQQAEAALDAQRAQSHALKRRILELQVQLNMLHMLCSTARSATAQHQ